MIEKKLHLLEWRRQYQIKFYVYIHPSMPLPDTIRRILWLRENKCLPYIMRDISCWDSLYRDFYIDLASYCNQVNLFKKLDFFTFLEKRHTNYKRIISSNYLWHTNI